MHKNNFVMAVKANGKVLREFEGSVYIPFGSEYSILLKNLTNTRARVHVTIDGEDALDGTSLIIDKKDEVDLKRFIKNGNFDRGNAFKFIEKTAAVSKHRGDKAEDGLITITYEFERDIQLTGSTTIFTPAKPDWLGPKSPSYLYNGYPPGVAYSNNFHTFVQSDSEAEVPCTTYSSTIIDNRNVLRKSARGMPAGGEEQLSASNLVPVSDPTRAGVTAPGSVTDQKFVTASYFFGSGKIETMTLQLLGQVGEVEVTRPVQVTKQINCKMCGKKARQTDKFCSQCGASVEIV